MVFRSRSKYGPGGGFLVFFEQISRFIWLSMISWIILSSVLIFFVADGKVTDSFDLRIVRGLVSEGRIFWMAVAFIGFSGVVGGLIALPSAFVLFLCRQYLDYQVTRAVRRKGAIKVKIARALPILVLLLSHVLVLYVNIICAPQVSRRWLKKDTPVSAFLMTSHFSLSSLARNLFERSLSGLRIETQETKVPSDKVTEGHKIHLVLVPADFLEGEEFKAERSQLGDFQTFPYIMSRSNVIEEIEGFFDGINGAAVDFFKKALHSPEQYGTSLHMGSFETVVSLSPQLSFGTQLRGLGSDSFSHLKDHVLIHEAQRRLIISQVHVYCFLRLLQGSRIFGKKIDWLEFFADDVFRIKNNAKQVEHTKKESTLISAIQLTGVENHFSNIQIPLRPVSWPTELSALEKKIVTRNTINELRQYFESNDLNENSFWAVLPYADDKRRNPVSFALLKSNSLVTRELGSRPNHESAIINSELGQILSKFLGDASSDHPHSADNLQFFKKQKILDAEPLTCFEIETDLKSAEFSFPSSETREKNLSDFLNALPHLNEADVSFLNSTKLRLFSRDPGSALLCRTERKSFKGTYLLKYRGDESYSKQYSHSNGTSSILLSPHTAQNQSSIRQNSMRFARPKTITQPPIVGMESSVKNDVLEDCLVYKLAATKSQFAFAWKELDEQESSIFFSKFDAEIVKAIEFFARERMR